jgi:transcriptional regulator with XRE-family HTH domain
MESVEATKVSGSDTREGLDYRSRQLAGILSQLSDEDGTFDIEEVKRVIKMKRHGEFNPLRQLRKQHGLTQEKAADLCGVSKLTVSNYETGKCSPQLDRLIRYSTALLLSDNEDSSVDLGTRQGDWVLEDEVVSLVSDYSRWLMKSEEA